jgi:hypothetical protein
MCIYILREICAKKKILYTEIYMYYAEESISSISNLNFQLLFMLYQCSRTRHLLESLVVMATVRQKVDCVLCLAEFKSITRVQSKFWLVHGGSTPSYNSVKKQDRRMR